LDGMFVLAIETSCDDTSVSILQHGIIQGNVSLLVLFYKTITHASVNGGVIPELVSRDHAAHLPELVRESCLALQKQTDGCLEAIAVTTAPGLLGPLLVGKVFAEGFAAACGIPCWHVHHIDAHIMPALWWHNHPVYCLNEWLPVDTVIYPHLGLTVSGGHTQIYYRHSAQDPKVVVGRSIDDAVGESLDKVARILGLGFPGGPLIEKLAQGYNTENRVDGIEPLRLPTVQLSVGVHKTKNKQANTDSNTQFPISLSYSGLKTAVLRYWQCIQTKVQEGSISQDDIRDIKIQMAWEFQNKAFNQIIYGVTKAYELYPQAEALYAAGGVLHNKLLRSMLAGFSKPTRCAPQWLATDNAVMIGMQALYDQYSQDIV
jgi:N6-L-threonylcarbamoyladenine synthase